MPQTRVNIPGVGFVTFPEGMSQDQIAQEAAKLHLQTAGQTPLAQTPQQLGPPPSTLDTFLQYSGLKGLGELAKGAGKGVMSTGMGVGKLLGTVPSDTTLGDIGMQPEGAVQKIGFGGEQIGEFALPSGLIGKGAKAVEGVTAASRLAPAAKTAINLATRAGLEGLGAAAVTTAQQGKTDNALTAGATAGGLSLAIPAALKLAGITANKIENVLIKATKKDVEDGFKVENVFKYNLGGTLEQTLKKADAKTQELTAIAGALRGSQPVNLKLALAEAGQELQNAAPRNVGGNKKILSALQSQLDELDILIGNGQLQQNGEAAMDVAHQVLQGVGQEGAWAYGSRDADAIAAEKVANAFYTAIRKRIEAASPAGSVLHDVNKSIGEIIPIKQAIIRRIPVEARNSVLHLSDIVSISAGHFPLLALANRAARSGTVAKGFNALSQMPSGQLPRLITGATQQ